MPRRLLDHGCAPSADQQKQSVETKESKRPVSAGQRARFGFNEADWQLLSLAHRFQVQFIVDWLVQPQQALKPESLAEKWLLADKLQIPALKVLCCSLASA